MRWKKHLKKRNGNTADALDAIRELKKQAKKNKTENAQQIEQAVREQIAELEGQIRASEQEYDAVTSYLTDIQKIERMEPKQRQIVNDAARAIINLNRERQKFQNNGERLAGDKYRVMERYEKEIPDEMRNMYEQEQYQNMVKGDLRQLEGERAVIQYEIDDAEDKKHFVKNLAIGSGILQVFLFGTLLALYLITDTNMTLPLLLIVAMTAAIAAYIAAIAVKCESILQESVFKMNRVIQLTNKIKIKLVNCTNTLEYCYDKYKVESYRELAANWEKYVQTRDEERRYRNSSGFLEQYSAELISTLRRHGVADAEIWIYQTEALLEEREMVEVRHHLNERRRKIRERLEFNTEQLAMCRAELAAFSDTKG